MKCPNCNHLIDENQKFCPECGTPLSQAITLQEIQKQETNNIPNDESTKNKKNFVLFRKTKKHRKLVISLIIATPLLIIATSVFLYIFFNTPVDEPCDHLFAAEEIITPATCFEEGTAIKKCIKCGMRAGNTYQIAPLEHRWNQDKCGEDTVCKNCGNRKYHSYNEETGTCEHCGIKPYCLNMPSVPITVRDDYGTCIISELEFNASNSNISFSIERTYHKQGSNISSTPEIGWKLYNDAGLVIKSGTEWANAAIKVGEKTRGSFDLPISKWDESTYTFEILDVS